GQFVAAEDHEKLILIFPNFAEWRDRAPPKQSSSPSLGSPANQAFPPFDIHDECSFFRRSSLQFSDDLSLISNVSSVDDRSYHLSVRVMFATAFLVAERVTRRRLRGCMASLR